MSKIKKTKKQIQKKLHPNKKQNTKNKKIVSKVMSNKQIAKVATVVQDKVVDNAEKVAKELVLEAKQTKEEITNNKKQMQFHPLLIIVIGVALGVIPFIFYRTSASSDGNDAGYNCKYTEWKKQDSIYCMNNATGDYYEGELTKYVYDSNTKKCTRYTRNKTCE